MMTDTETPRARDFVLLVAAAIGVYVNSLWNGFAYDDVHIIVQNARVHQLSDLGAIWLTPYWPTLGAELGLWRPLTIFGYALQWAASGGAAWFFHLNNVLFHALVSVLAFLLLATLVERRAALAGALVFAVHPLHVEAVANVVGQAELLAAAGVLAACLVHARRPVGSAAITLPRIGAMSVLYALAMLAKEGAIVLPALLVLVDLAQHRVRPAKAFRYLQATRMVWIILAATAILYLAFRVDVLGSIGGKDAGPSLPYLREETSRILTAFRAWPEFARLLFFPLDLSADYAPAVVLPVTGPTPMAMLGAAILLLTIVLAAASVVRPAVGVGAAWFLVGILPVSNLLFPIGVLLAERTLYLPSFGLSLIVAYGWAAARAAPDWERRGRVASAAALAVLALLGARTVIRNPDWKDTPTVLEALLRDHPESYRAQWSASHQLMEAGDTAAALDHLELAYRLWPRDSQVLANLGALYIYLGRSDRAVGLLEESRALVDYLPRTEYLLAIAYLNTGRYEEALAAVHRSLRMAGPEPHLFDIRGRALLGLDRNEEAVASLRAAIRQPGGNGWEQWSMLARGHARLGDSLAAAAAIDSARARAAADSSASRAVTDNEAVVHQLLRGGPPPEGSKSATSLQDARPFGSTSAALSGGSRR